MFSKSLFSVAGIAAAAFAAFGALQVSATAQAQSDGKTPVILIVDQARLIATSKAGNSIAEQMKTLQATANKELEAEVGRITKEAEELKSKQGQMEEKAYIETAKRLAIQQNNLPVLREVKLRELALSEQKAIGQISEKMRPILKKIVEDRGATILLDRSAVMYASQNTDITEEVLTKLDAEISSVKVERVSLAAQQQ